MNKILRTKEEKPVLHHFDEKGELLTLNLIPRELAILRAVDAVARELRRALP